MLYSNQVRIPVGRNCKLPLTTELQTGVHGIFICNGYTCQAAALISQMKKDMLSKAEIEQGENGKKDRE